MSQATHRRLLPLLAVTALLGLTACNISWKKVDGTEDDDDFAGYLIAVEKGEVVQEDGKKNIAFDGELVVKADKKASGTAFGFVRFNRSLSPPFRVTMQGGIDPAVSTGFAGNSQFCIELDERQSITGDIADLEYILICARREGNGLRVRALSKTSSFGNVLITDTDIVELAIEHDGTDLIFEARATEFGGGVPTDGGFTEVARVNNFTVDDAYLPSQGASFLSFPAEVMFDRGRVEFSGDPSGQPTAEEALAYDLYAAIDALLEGIYSLDGFSPDTAGARTLAVTAQNVLTQAAIDVETLDKSKAQKKARGKIKKAGKKVASTIKAIDKGKPQKPLVKKIAVSLKLVMSAVEALDPVP